MNGRHANFVSRYLGGKAVRQRRELLRGRFGTLVKSEKQSPCLVGQGIPQLDLAVNSTGTNQRRVKALEVIRRQEQHPAFARTDSIQGVEQAAQCHACLFRGCSLGLEHAVDILD